MYVVNDIALVRLPRDARLNPGVQLVCLGPRPGQDRWLNILFLLRE